MLMAMLISIICPNVLKAQERITKPPGGNQQLPRPVEPPKDIKPDIVPIKDILPCGSTVRDASGNVYNVVQIGTQCWMKENLRTTRFRNGDEIRELRVGETVPTPIVSMYARPVPAIGLGTTSQVEAAILKFGRLYNIQAILNPRGICPAGWHVPTKAEYETLINFLGGAATAGGHLKAIDVATNSWGASNIGATNSSGFSALPGGRLLLTYEDISCCFARYWTINPSPVPAPRPGELPTRYQYLNLTANSAAATFGNSVPGDFGSCRCIKD